MVKLVASDLDGTLLLHKAQSLPEEIFSADQAVRGTGDYVCGSQWKTISEYDKAVLRLLLQRFPIFRRMVHWQWIMERYCIRILLTESWQGRLFLQSWKRRMPSLPVLQRITTI